MSNSWCNSNYKKEDLDGKGVWFKFSQMPLAQIGKFHVEENAEGKLKVEVRWIDQPLSGVINTQIRAGKVLLNQANVDLIKLNKNEGITAEFVIEF